MELRKVQLTLLLHTTERMCSHQREAGLAMPKTSNSDHDRHFTTDASSDA